MGAVGVEGARSKKARADEALAAEEEKNKAEPTESDKEARAAKKKKKDAQMKAQANDMLDKVQSDPELNAMIQANPKLQRIVEEVKANPMAGMKYMSDPEVAPFMRKAMHKLMPGGIPGVGDLGSGSRGGKGASKGKGGGGLNKDKIAEMMAGLQGGAGGGPDLTKL